MVKNHRVADMDEVVIVTLNWKVLVSSVMEYEWRGVVEDLLLSARHYNSRIAPPL